MTLIPPSRKRNRSCGEEDFLPLSKKINNLHINNWGNLDSSPDHLLMWNNRTEQWLASQHSLLMNGGRSEEESLDSSLFETAQESNFQNCFNKTDNEKCFEQDSYESNSSQSNYESKIQDGRQNGWSMVYNPDLSMEENPYYYENNKLLFELYMERLHRGGGY